MTKRAKVLSVRDPFGTKGEVIEGEEFYVSYNPKPAPIFGYSGPETALVKNNTYRILRGRWIDDYATLVPKGWDRCLNFYNEQKEVYGSRWSMEEELQ